MYHFLHISIVLNSNTCLKMQKKKTNIKKWFFQQLCLTEMTLSEYLWFQYSIDFWLFNWMFYHHQAGGFMFLIAVWWPHNIAAKCQKGSCFQSIDRLIQCFSKPMQHHFLHFCKQWFRQGPGWFRYSDCDTENCLCIPVGK